MATRKAFSLEKTVELTFTVIECYKCGVPFGITADYEDRRRRDKDTFYCPNGHGQAYVKSREDALHERNEALAAENEGLRRDKLQLSDDLLDKAKELRRVKRRTRAGVCEFCKRHFENVERHYKTKHPGCVHK